MFNMSIEVQTLDTTTHTLEGIPLDTDGKRHGQDWANWMMWLDKGERVEVTEAEMDYFMDILPPVFMRRRVTLCNGESVYANFGVAEGSDPIIAYWSEQGKHFCQQVK